MCLAENLLFLLFSQWQAVSLSKAHEQVSNCSINLYCRSCCLAPLKKKICIATTFSLQLPSWKSPDEADVESSITCPQRCWELRTCGCWSQHSRLFIIYTSLRSAPLHLHSPPWRVPWILAGQPRAAASREDLSLCPNGFGWPRLSHFRCQTLSAKWFLT